MVRNCISCSPIFKMFDICTTAGFRLGVDHTQRADNQATHTAGAAGKGMSCTIIVFHQESPCQR
jgi:hypothetical protein